MSLGIELVAVGDEREAERFERIAARLQDPRPAFERIAAALIGGERELFARAIRPAISAATRQRKAHDRDPRVRAHAALTMVSTGELRDALTGGRYSHLQLDRTHLRFGIASELAGRRFAARDRNVLVSAQFARRAATGLLREFLIGR